MFSSGSGTLRHLFSGFIHVREMSGKFIFFQGQGIIREFCVMSWKNEPASVAQLDVRPTGDQEVAGSTPAEVGNILSWRLIMKYFLRSFSPFR